LFSPDTYMLYLTREEMASAQGALRLVFVHRRKCPYSKSLYGELKVASRSSSPVVVRCIDLGRIPDEQLRDSWLPGTPCYVHAGDVHLGIDAFRQCRELIRSVDGLCLVEEGD
jgi:hypothetical protein